MATVLKGQVDGIVLTGGLAYYRYFVELIKERCEFIAPVYLYPGEDEMRALLEGALRVLRGQEPARVYEKEIREV
jgi:Butyrate kinase